VSFFLASDVHLRLDRPERGRRFRRWVQQLVGKDALLIAGDLCDFWMAARLPESELMQCEGLRALADFRARGGTLNVLAGNHDAWLCPFYERELGATLRNEPYDISVHGLRLHIVHGHLLGARRKWKGLMEGRPFFRSFGHIPAPAARLLDQILEWKNQRELQEDESRHIKVFREYSSSRVGQADLVVIGHVHRAVDDTSSCPRMIILGGWQERSSYLMIDTTGASFHVLADEPAIIPLDSPPSEPRLMPIP
jgi:UDP-2,3-diacylglucosamine hydrolase